MEAPDKTLLDVANSINSNDEIFFPDDENVTSNLASGIKGAMYADERVIPVMNSSETVEGGEDEEGDDFCESETESESSSDTDDDDDRRSILGLDDYEVCSKKSILEMLCNKEVVFPALKEDQDIAIVCDNPNALKRSIQKMGSRVRACQDPFHLIWRSTAKVRKDCQRRLSKLFHHALYDPKRILRPREDMFYRVRTLLQDFPEDEITASRDKRRGTTNNTLFQIREEIFVQTEAKTFTLNMGKNEV
ncbi:hypothetical protein DFJ73DRAFT_501616 [Zopfochytrium polystomum]|nr:hypothetical protein DFJ73DRAFT_501616 [Zopfochytrium polystomum]